MDTSGGESFVRQWCHSGHLVTDKQTDKHFFNLGFMDMIIQGNTCLLNYSVLMWQQVRNTDWSLHVLFPFVDCMTMMNRDRLM